MSDSTFQDDWGFAADVKATIEGAVYYDVRPTPEIFKTGRLKYECLFLDASKNRAIERRPAMELISKRTGKPYNVVSRKLQPAARQAAPAERQPTAQPTRQPAPHQPYTLDDVLADLPGPSGL